MASLAFSSGICLLPNSQWAGLVFLDGKRKAQAHVCVWMWDVLVNI